MNEQAQVLPFSSGLISIAKDQISSDLAGEAVILNLQSGTYYGLNTVGSRVWQLLQTPQTLDRLRTAILEEYQVDEQTCDRDLVALLQELETAGLIEVNHEATP